MSNCYASPRHGGEIAVKNNLSVAEKTRLHWIQRNPTEHKAGECSTTQAGQLFPNIALLIFIVCLHQWLFNYFFFVSLPPRHPIGWANKHYGDTSIEKESAPLRDTEHITWEQAAVLGRAYTYLSQTGKLEAPSIHSNGDLSCPGKVFHLNKRNVTI